MAVTTKEQANGDATSISKMDAVKTALKQLGRKAQPLAIQDFVKEQFHLTMTTAHISNYKSMILNGSGGRKKGLRSHSPDTAVQFAKRTPSHRGGHSGITIDDIETVKSLVNRVGADSLKTLIDLLHR